MANMIIEAVIVAFCVGGALGALLAMQLVQHPTKHAHVKTHRRHPGK